jgi:2-polyprenyl-3-methyl-5-hydroxy-6-metoxy-1,4-benzoquinol methylase
MIDLQVRTHYDCGGELPRLTSGRTLKLVRTQELLKRYLPPSLASVLDVGGGPGVYAPWLATRGYQVHLIDPMPLHFAETQELASRQPSAAFTAAQGDARRSASGK